MRPSSVSVDKLLLYPQTKSDIIHAIKNDSGVGKNVKSSEIQVEYVFPGVTTCPTDTAEERIVFVMSGNGQVLLGEPPFFLFAKMQQECLFLVQLHIEIYLKNDLFDHL